MTDHDPRIQTPTLAELLIAANNADWGQVVCNGGPPCFHFDRERQRFCLAAERWAGHKQYHPFMNLADMVGNYLATVAAVTRESVEGPTPSINDVHCAHCGRWVGNFAFVGTARCWECASKGAAVPTVQPESVGGRDGRIEPEHATALQIALLEQQARADKWELTCRAKDAQLTALQAEVERLRQIEDRGL